VSTAPVVAPTSARTLPVDDPVELIPRLPADGALAWVRQGEGLVGWGEAARFETSGPDRFAEAEQWWTAYQRSLVVDDPIGLPGTGPVAFATFAFDPRPGLATLVVPSVVLGRRAGRAWLTVLGDPRHSTVGVPAPTRPGGFGRIRYSEGSRTAPDWESSVGAAVQRIVRGELDKVVLARDLVATADEPIDPRVLMRRLAQRYPDCWTFCVDQLVGATPELLVRRVGGSVTSRVLAGTVSRLGDDVADGRLASALLGSDKDLEEHVLAVRSVAAALADHCTDLEVPTEPRVLTLANVQHLVTDVTGRLADGASALALADALHPTAAVCGTPTDVALRLIRELEGMDRGGYAGPVGWVGRDGDGEFGIALRCAEVSGQRARLFAGCGIVAGSNPEAELAEAQAKLVAVRDALEADD